MGVITLVLIAANLQPADTGPQPWVILASGLAIALGTYSGGWRIMRTMGKGIVDIETPQGAAAGAQPQRPSCPRPTSDSACPRPMSARAASSAQASAEGADIRWGLARRMLVAWVLTLPGAGLIGGLAALLAPHGVVGVIALLILLAAACLVIFILSRRHRVDHTNVTDSREVLVLASASPSAYAPDGAADKKARKPRDRSGV